MKPVFDRFLAWATGADPAEQERRFVAVHRHLVGPPPPRRRDRVLGAEQDGAS